MAMKLDLIQLQGGPKHQTCISVSKNRTKLSIPVMIDGRLMLAQYNKSDDKTFCYSKLMPVQERKVIYTKQPTWR